MNRLCSSSDRCRRTSLRRVCKMATVSGDTGRVLKMIPRRRCRCVQDRKLVATLSIPIGKVGHFAGALEVDMLAGDMRQRKNHGSTLYGIVLPGEEWNGRLMRRSKDYSFSPSPFRRIHFLVGVFTTTFSKLVGLGNGQEALREEIWKMSISVA